MEWTSDGSGRPELSGLLLRYGAILVMEGVTRRARQSKPMVTTA